MIKPTETREITPYLWLHPPAGYEGRPEKAAGQYPAASRAQNLAFENARPPGFADLHLASEGDESKLLFPLKEQTSRCS
jgi:hypothetical protein